mmetsp:Transcript_18851/g.54874  ORF Transcript_18851/g.54874 Transcript_18851/m.54874 type:complete len:296 (-) Transcript_18851:759-1646(-)
MASQTWPLHRPLAAAAPARWTANRWMPRALMHILSELLHQSLIGDASSRWSPSPSTSCASSKGDSRSTSERRRVRRYWVEAWLGALAFGTVPWISEQRRDQREGREWATCLEETRTFPALSGTEMGVCGMQGTASSGHWPKALTTWTCSFMRRRPPGTAAWISSHTLQPWEPREWRLRPVPRRRGLGSWLRRIRIKTKVLGGARRCPSAPCAVPCGRSRSCPCWRSGGRLVSPGTGTATQVRFHRTLRALQPRTAGMLAGPQEEAVAAAAVTAVCHSLAPSALKVSSFRTCTRSV